MRLYLYFVAALLFSSLWTPAVLDAQQSRPNLRLHIDTDGDGLSDELEQALLVQFAPSFMVSRIDCSNVPAEFVPGQRTPKIEAEDSTIYGQAFPAKASSGPKPIIEIHYYHLWKRDCGAHGHPLDAEHVSVLVQASSSDLVSAKWKAVYWFAAAHENTVCDVSQIARASTLDAEKGGAKVWISAGKHASFLNEMLCQKGCGNDLCGNTRPLSIGKIINLGEPSQPMNGSLWIASSRWPLTNEMTGTDFPPAPIRRLNSLPSTDIAWFSPARHPTQGIIAISSSTADALGSSGQNTATAMSVASDSAENALKKSYRKTADALGSSVSHIGKFLHPKQKSK